MVYTVSAVYGTITGALETLNACIASAALFTPAQGTLKSYSSVLRSQCPTGAHLWQWSHTNGTCWYLAQHLNDTGAFNLEGMCVMIGKPFGDRTTVGQLEVVQASDILFIHGLYLSP